jgi:predicted metalloprotease
VLQFIDQKKREVSEAPRAVGVYRKDDRRRGNQPMNEAIRIQPVDKEECELAG